MKRFKVGDRVRVKKVATQPLIDGGLRVVGHINTSGEIGTIVEAKFVGRDGKGAYGVRLDNAHNSLPEAYFANELEKVKEVPQDTKTSSGV